MDYVTNLSGLYTWMATTYSVGFVDASTFHDEERSEEERETFRDGQGKKEEKPEVYAVP